MTHDYRASTRGWGHDIHYSPLDGDRLRAGGWGHGLKPGDYLLLTNPDDRSETRYSVGDDLRYCWGSSEGGNGHDQWFATLHFAPRP